MPWHELGRVRSLPSDDSAATGGHETLGTFLPHSEEEILQLVNSSVIIDLLSTVIQVYIITQSTINY